MFANRVPGLLIFPNEEESQSDAWLFGFNDEKERILVDYLKYSGNAHYSGSSFGWLVMLNDKHDLYVLNPFLGFQIQLPVLHYPSEFKVQSFDFVTKSLLTSDPLEKNSSCRVIVVYGRNSRIGYCGLKDSSWVDLDCKSKSYLDIVYFNHLLFAVSSKGSVEVWDFQTDFPKQLMNIELLFPEKSFEIGWSLRDLCARKCYLVESGFNILLVVRFIGELVDGNGKPVHEADLMIDEDPYPLVCPYRTLFFHVYRLDFNYKKWVEVDSLGDQAVFVGASESMSVSVGDSTNCKRNSIYFSDDYWDRMDEDYSYGGHDIGVFSLEDQRLTQFYFDSEKMLPAPHWVVPNK